MLGIPAPPRTEHPPYSPTGASYPLQETPTPSGSLSYRIGPSPPPRPRARFHGAVSIFIREEESDEASKRPPMQIPAVTVIKHPEP